MNLRLHDKSDNDTQEVFRMIDEIYPGDPYSQSDLARVILKYPTWFIEDGGIVACLVSEVSKGQPYVWSVSTRPSHRGRGCATLLMKEFEQHYKALGYGKPWLNVRVENPAQKLYFDLGYRVAAFEANLYGARQHGMTMRKYIG